MLIRGSAVEVEITGTVHQLRAVGEAIAALNTGESCHFTAEWCRNPTPYLWSHSTLEVTATEGSVRVAVIEDRLQANGSPEMLRVFSSHFLFPDDARPQTHTHHEWYEGNEYISPDSVPLVISVR